MCCDRCARDNTCKSLTWKRQDVQAPALSRPCVQVRFVQSMMVSEARKAALNPCTAARVGYKHKMKGQGAAGAPHGQFFDRTTRRTPERQSHAAVAAVPPTTHLEAASCAEAGMGSGTCALASTTSMFSSCPFKANTAHASTARRASASCAKITCPVVSDRPLPAQAGSGARKLRKAAQAAELAEQRVAASSRQAWC